MHITKSMSQYFIFTFYPESSELYFKFALPIRQLREVLITSIRAIIITPCFITLSDWCIINTLLISSYKILVFLFFNYSLLDLLFSSITMEMVGSLVSYPWRDIYATSHSHKRPNVISPKTFWKRHVFMQYVVLWHVDPLLGSDREIDDCKVAVARQRPTKNRAMVFSAPSAKQ
jgi:hypothetical protein